MTEAERAALVERIAATIERCAETMHVIPNAAHSAAGGILAAIEPVIRADERERCAAHLDALAEDTPLGHENKQRGASTYNWLRAHAAAIRSLKEDKP